MPGIRNSGGNLERHTTQTASDEEKDFTLFVFRSRGELASCSSRLLPGGIEYYFLDTAIK